VTPRPAHAAPDRGARKVAAVGRSELRSSKAS